MKKALCLLVFLLPAILVAAPAPDQKPIVNPTEFIKLKKEKGKVSALEIAITHYEDRVNKVKVDLVGVVHIGDTSYYEELNTRLAKYDVVLYELVAPRGTKPKKKEKSDNILSMLPKAMSVMMDLDMQLSVVDYDKKNFVHADMSFDEMMEAAKERGETGLTLGLSIILDSLRQNNKKGKVVAEEIDFSKAIDNPNLLKQSMAEQMANNMEMGETIKKLLVNDRNKKACKVLDKEILAGKKTIAIFYGAAHNADFDERLRKDRKMICTGQEWLTAWGGLNKKPVPIEVRLLKLLMEK